METQQLQLNWLTQEPEVLNLKEKGGNVNSTSKGWPSRDLLPTHCGSCCASSRLLSDKLGWPEDVLVTAHVLHLHAELPCAHPAGESHQAGKWRQAA